LALVTAGAAFLGVVLQQIPGMDIMPASTVDNTIMTLVLVPVLEYGRRVLADYSTQG
jgi:hypothetical protein